MNSSTPNPDLIALGIQQPWVELILRGIKTIEVRSQATKVRGTIYLYASKKHSSLPAASVQVKQHQLPLEELPCGLLVGTVDIVDCVPCHSKDATAACVPADLLKNHYAWKLAHPVRLEKPLKVKFLPYGVWFYPFKRRGDL